MQSSHRPLALDMFSSFLNEIATSSGLEVLEQAAMTRADSVLGRRALSKGIIGPDELLDFDKDAVARTRKKSK